jgi:hypothetical protein
LKQIIYREPNRIKRWWRRQFFQAEIAGQEMNFLRIRWWPIVAPLTVWIGHNLFILFWVMLSALAGRTPSFDASSVWYAPLHFVLELMR